MYSLKAYHIKHFLVALILLSAFTAYGQITTGIDAGVSNNQLNTNITNRLYTTIRNDHGFTFGIPVELKLSSHFYLESGSNITQKNYTILRTEQYTGIYQSYRNTYIQIPININYAVGNKLQFIINTGLYGSYWLWGRVKGTIADIYSINGTTDANGNPQQTFQLKAYNEKYQFNSQRDNRYEFGWTFGTSVKYHFSNKYTIHLKFTSYQSLTDQQKNYMINQVPAYNQTYTLSLGIIKTFKLTKQPNEF